MMGLLGTSKFWLVSEGGGSGLISVAEMERLVRMLFSD